MVGGGVGDVDMRRLPGFGHVAVLLLLLLIVLRLLVVLLLVICCVVGDGDGGHVVVDVADSC